MQGSHEDYSANHRDSSRLIARKLSAELFQPEFNDQLNGFLETLLCLIQKHPIQHLASEAILLVFRVQ